MCRYVVGLMLLALLPAMAAMQEEWSHTHLI